ncbi:MAG: hypothetical protein HY763_05160 [Planctomycetes bacterium]|nr:hypothetical protein [Planctomycetota bacterium]
MPKDIQPNLGRVFAYCHDSVGIGHLARTLNICKHLGHEYPFTTFLLATGTPYVSMFEHLPRLDYIKLPTLAKEASHRYRSKYLTMATDELIRCREGILQQAVEHFEPDVVLVDKAPLGVCRELLPTLRWLRRNRPQTRIVFGMRDIEDSPEATVAQWDADGVPAALEAVYDEIWCYGMRSVFDVVAEYRLSPAIADKLRFVGYVAQEPCGHPPLNGSASRSVLVTVGGGTDGEFLLSTYLNEAAVQLARHGVRSTLVGGPDLPDDVAERLRGRASATAGVDWVDFDPCMNCRIRRADVVVSMGGYNTLCQIARNRKRSLVVPRIYPRLEQSIRARLWAGRGIVEVVEPAELTPSELSAHVAAMVLDGREPEDAGLDFHGLRRIRDRFHSFWYPETADARALRV